MATSTSVPADALASKTALAAAAVTATPRTNIASAPPSSPACSSAIAVVLLSSRILRRAASVSNLAGSLHPSNTSTAGGETAANAAMPDR